VGEDAAGYTFSPKDHMGARHLKRRVGVKIEQGELTFSGERLPRMNTEKHYEKEARRMGP